MLLGPGWGRAESFHAVMALKWGKWSRVNKCPVMFSFLNLAVTNYCITRFAVWSRRFTERLKVSVIGLEKEKKKLNVNIWAHLKLSVLKCCGFASVSFHQAVILAVSICRVSKLCHACHVYGFHPRTNRSLISIDSQPASRL